MTVLRVSSGNRPPSLWVVGAVLLLTACGGGVTDTGPAERSATLTSTGAVSSPAATGETTSGASPSGAPSTSSSTAAPDRVRATPRARIGAESSSGAIEPPLVKPESWPRYSFSGPTDLDICATADYPLDRLLERGDGTDGGRDLESQVVRSLQAGLRSLNYGNPDPVDATGYFGAVTERAVRSFQERKGLVVDGTVGQQTWGSLHSWVNAYEGNCP